MLYRRSSYVIHIHLEYDFGSRSWSSAAHLILFLRLGISALYRVAEDDLVPLLEDTCGPSVRVQTVKSRLYGWLRML